MPKRNKTNKFENPSHFHEHYVIGFVEKGKRELPGFSKNVVCDEEIACHLRPLHEMVMKGTGEFKREENLLFLLSYLIQNYGKPFESCIPECRHEIEKACEYMAVHEMTKAELYYYVDLSSGMGTYDVKPVWILSGYQKGGKKMQIIIDAQTAEEILS